MNENKVWFYFTLIFGFVAYMFSVLAFSQSMFLIGVVEFALGTILFILNIFYFGRLIRKVTPSVGDN